MHTHTVIWLTIKVLTLNKYQLNSLDFVVNRFSFSKLFKTNSMLSIEFYREQTI